MVPRPLSYHAFMRDSYVNAYIYLSLADGGFSKCWLCCSEFGVSRECMVEKRPGHRVTGVCIFFSRCRQYKPYWAWSTGLLFYWAKHEASPVEGKSKLGGRSDQKNKTGRPVKHWIISRRHEEMILSFLSHLMSLDSFIMVLMPDSRIYWPFIQCGQLQLVGRLHCIWFRPSPGGDR